MIKRTMKKWRGFTLIELLVVVAIIGILAALIMTNLIGIRQRARDAQRKSDVRQIQSAVELYRSDLGAYPTAIGSCGASYSLTSVGVTNNPPNGANIYMKAIPCDPLNGSVYTYATPDSGTTYSLIACLENANDSQKDASNVAPCTGTTNFSFTVKNP